MSIHAIAPSPLARLLLELEARAASGGIDAGGRRLVLLRGGLLEVRPGPNDSGLGEFLVAAGRLEPEELAACKQYAAEQRISLEAALHQKDLTPLDVLLETRRALWLERFVRGLAKEEQDGKEPSLLSPEPYLPQGPTIPLLPFVLDALTRRASFEDAEHIGRSATAWFEWLDTPQRNRASLWADFGEFDEAMQLGSLFGRHPAAPSRIAALTRAGLARLSERKLSVPGPGPRTPSIVAPAPEPPKPTTGSIAPPPMPRLEPGEVRIERSPLVIEPLSSWFPRSRASLDDPLDPLERRIARLEQTGAPQGERARAWLELARAWREHFDCTDEAARASREAAGAAPELPEALEAAARACSTIGRPDLAYAYAAAWAKAEGEPARQLRAWLDAAHYATRAAKQPSALRALQHAVELDTEGGATAERYARALAASGDIAGAVVAARLAAKRYRESSPRAARSVLSWALGIAPNEPELAGEYAASLAVEGYVEAAVAVAARGARRASARDAARKLYRYAAGRAEHAARPDLAGEVMLEALDVLGPEEQLLRVTLLDSLTAAGSVVEVAVLAHELSRDLTGSARAAFLVRAADARLELPGDAVLAVELYSQALCAAPLNARALSALHDLADADTESARVLIDALERALRLHASSEFGPDLLSRFMSALRRRGDAPMLERWALEFAAQHEHLTLPEEGQRDLALRSAQWESEVRALEQALRQSTPETRTEAGLRLAERLRDDPARRTKARKILEKIVEVEPNHGLARGRLEALLRLQEDTQGLCDLAARRAREVSGDLARIAALLACAHAENAAGHTRAAADACLALLTLAPKHREGALLLLRLSKRLGDPVLAQGALTRRVAASLDPRERALALCALARHCLDSSQYDAAIAHAEAALSTDPRCAAAALLLVEHLDTLDVSRRLPVLQAARTVLADSPELLQLLGQAHYGAGDAKGQLEVLESHLHLAPFDPLPALGLLTLRTTGTDAQAILTALRNVLSVERFGDGSVAAAASGIERLWMLGQRVEAVSFVVEAVNALGETVDELLDWAAPCVRDLGDVRLERAVLERLVVRTVGEARANALRGLAVFYREQADRVGEARTYLRLLAIEPADGEALERLAHIYAEAGELERVMSVLTVRLDLATSPEDRRERLLSLACAALDLADDPHGAEEFVRAALAIEEGSEPSDEIVRRGVGLLLGSKAPQLAFDLLLTLSEEASPPRARALLEEAVFIAENTLANRDLALRAATLGIESHPEHTPFLLHFERLALAAGELQTGRDVYSHLVDKAMGVHGRRALLYRAARWLERAGSPAEALDAAEQAFAIAPAEGAMLSMLERLAQTTGRHEALAWALRLLADTTPLARDKHRVLQRAASLHEARGELEEALGCCEQALRHLPDEPTQERALALLSRLPNHARTAARERLCALFEEQAREAWATVARVRALLALSQLALDGQAARDAEHHLREAQAALYADEDLPEAERNALLARHRSVAERLHTYLLDGTRARGTALEAIRPPESAGAHVPRVSQERATVSRHLAVAVGAFGTPEPPLRSPSPTSEPPYDPRERSSAPLNRVPHRMGDEAAMRPRTHTDPGFAPVTPRVGRERLSQVHGALGASHDDVQQENRLTPSRSDPPLGAFGAAPEVPSLDALPIAPASVVLSTLKPENQTASERLQVEHAEDERVIETLVYGHASALARLEQLVLADHTQKPHLARNLLARVRRTVPRVSALRALKLLAEGHDAPVTRVCGEILDYADGHHAQAAAEIHSAASLSAQVQTALLDARDDGALSPVFTLLAHVSQGAAPLFRRPLSSYGVSTGDLIAGESPSPQAAALQRVASMLGVEYDAYLQRGGPDHIALIPTQPLAILIGEQTHGSASLLCHRLARMFEGARAGSSLIASLTPDYAQMLLAAVKAAFGPADTKSPPVAREAAALAAELWRTMPSSVQRQVSNLFRVLHALPTYDALREHLCGRSARVGLVLTGSPFAALEAFGMDGDLAPVARTPEALDLALQGRVAVRELVAFALSESFCRSLTA